ncbi:phage tail protein [bacterium]|jgi:phage protein U|nr:phage tail protein [bacterium]
MFAQLGDIIFEVIPSFNGHNQTTSYHYVEHERIDNKPLLQYLGKNLQEDELILNFHQSFCVPELEIKKLKTAADKAAPLKFIKGNGEYVGVFVVEKIRETAEQTSAKGDLISIQLEVTLKEYAGNIPEEKNKQKGFKKKA